MSRRVVALLLLAGVLIVAGVALVSHAAGLIVAGVLVGTVAVLMIDVGSKPEARP